MVFLDSNKRDVVYYAGGQQILKQEGGELAQKYASQPLEIALLEGDTMVLEANGKCNFLCKKRV